MKILVVDDGSRDGTREVVQAFQARPGAAGLRLVSCPHRGLVATLNTGLELARAPLVARLDADDLALRGRLAKQRDVLMAHPDIAVVGTHVRCFPRRNVGGGLAAYVAWQNATTTPDDIARAMFIEAPLVHPSVMFRKAAVLDVGGYRDCGWPEDYDLWLRLFAAGHRFGKVPEVLVLWREHEARLTHRHPAYHADRLFDLRVHFLLQTVLRGRDTVQIWNAGRNGRRLARALAAGGVPPVRFFDIAPARIGRESAALSRGRGGVLIPVLSVSDLPRYRDTVTLIATPGRSARDAIRAALPGFGLIEGENAWLVG